MRVTKDWYEQYLAKEAVRTAKNNSPAQTTLPERPVCHEPLATNKGETSHTSRIHVSIISYRRRLLDPDNLCPKYFIDCLRYAGFLQDDREEDITLQVSQVKVKGKDQERTEIELSWMRQIPE